MDTEQGSPRVHVVEVEPPEQVEQNGRGQRRVIAGEDVSPEFAGMDIVDGPDDADYNELAPKAVSAAVLNKFLEQNPETRPTFRMILHQTTINLSEQTGGETQWARVRIVDLSDKALVGTLPAEVRKLIERLFFGGSANQRGNRNKPGAARMDEGLNRMRDVAYAYGCAGFVEPRLVMRPEDVKDPDKEVWVGAIALHDLTEFTRICEGDEQLAKRRLEGFPG